MASSTSSYKNDEFGSVDPFAATLDDNGINIAELDGDWFSPDFDLAEGENHPIDQLNNDGGFCIGVVADEKDSSTRKRGRGNVATSSATRVESAKGSGSVNQSPAPKTTGGAAKEKSPSVRAGTNSGAGGKSSSRKSATLGSKVAEVNPAAAAATAESIKQAMEEGLEALNIDPNSAEGKMKKKQLRNRLSAQLHRDHKKLYISDLEREVREYSEQVRELKSLLKMYVSENAMLRGQISTLAKTSGFNSLVQADRGMAQHVALGEAIVMPEGVMEHTVVAAVHPDQMARNAGLGAETAGNGASGAASSRRDSMSSECNSSNASPARDTATSTTAAKVQSAVVKTATIASSRGDSVPTSATKRARVGSAPNTAAARATVTDESGNDSDHSTESESTTASIHSARSAGALPAATSASATATATATASLMLQYGRNALTSLTGGRAVQRSDRSVVSEDTISNGNTTSGDEFDGEFNDHDVDAGHCQREQHHQPPMGMGMAAGSMDFDFDFDAEVLAEVLKSPVRGSSQSRGGAPGGAFSSFQHQQQFPGSSFNVAKQHHGVVRPISGAVRPSSAVMMFSVMFLFSFSLWASPYSPWQSTSQMADLFSSSAARSGLEGLNDLLDGMSLSDLMSKIAAPASSSSSTASVPSWEAAVGGVEQEMLDLLADSGKEAVDEKSSTAIVTLSPLGSRVKPEPEQQKSSAVAMRLLPAATSAQQGGRVLVQSRDEEDGDDDDYDQGEDLEIHGAENPNDVDDNQHPIDGAAAAGTNANALVQLNKLLSSTSQWTGSSSQGGAVAGSVAFEELFRGYATLLNSLVLQQKEQLLVMGQQQGQTAQQRQQAQQQQQQQQQSFKYPNDDTLAKQLWIYPAYDSSGLRTATPLYSYVPSPSSMLFNFGANGSSTMHSGNSSTAGRKRKYLRERTAGGAGPSSPPASTGVVPVYHSNSAGNSKELVPYSQQLSQQMEQLNSLLQLLQQLQPLLGPNSGADNSGLQVPSSTPPVPQASIFGDIKTEGGKQANSASSDKLADDDAMGRETPTSSSAAALFSRILVSDGKALLNPALMINGNEGGKGAAADGASRRSSTSVATTTPHMLKLLVPADTVSWGTMWPNAHASSEASRSSSTAGDTKLPVAASGLHRARSRSGSAMDSNERENSTTNSASNDSEEDPTSTPTDNVWVEISCNIVHAQLVRDVTVMQ